VLGAKVKLMALQEALLGLEVDAVEVVAGLVTEFDRCYSEMAEANKLQYNAYFTQVGCPCCALGYPSFQADGCFLLAFPACRPTNKRFVLPATSRD
jgi:hypothetical protein